jgi:RNA polymerase sigma-70 factor, ECF subfamily
MALGCPMTVRFHLRDIARFEAPFEVLESELIHGLKNGDEACLGPLMERYWEALTDYSQRFVRDPDRAADIVQSAFVRLWRHRREWTNTETLRPLLYRMVRNASLNARRDRNTFRDWLRRFPPPEKDPAPSPLQEAEGEALQDAVLEALETLPERRREIFVLVRFHHLSYREAAEALDVSSQTVANQVSLAMRDLRSALDAHLPPAHTLRTERAEAT